MKIRYQLEPRPLEQKKRWQTEHKGISTRSPRTGPGFTRDPDALGKAKWPGEHSFRIGGASFTSVRGGMTSWPLRAISIGAYIRAFGKVVAIDLPMADSVVGWDDNWAVSVGVRGSQLNFVVGFNLHKTQRSCSSLVSTWHSRIIVQLRSSLKTQSRYIFGSHRPDISQLS